MRNLSHHLRDETLQEYSAGLLSAPMEILIACHLTVCAECRKRSELADALGGLALNNETITPVKTSAQDILALDKTSAQLHSDTMTPIVGGSGLPNPLARLLPGPLNELPWKSFGRGMKQYNLSTQPRNKGAFKLLSLAPGLRMSKHTHNQRELTFIVSGSYSDEFGSFKPGDIADLSADHHHAPHVDSNGPCLSLIATDAPVKFDGLFGKIVQPFVGI